MSTLVTCDGIRSTEAACRAADQSLVDLAPGSLLASPARFLVRQGLTAFLRLLIRLEVTGLEHVPVSGPFILASNHSSHLDGALLVLALSGRRRLRIAAARDYFFRHPVQGWFCRHVLDLIPFERRSSSRAGLRLCLAALREPGPFSPGLLLFPEGTRTRDGRMQPFKPGVGILAMETGVPVVPAWISGTFPLLPQGRHWPKPGRVRIALGPALHPLTPAQAPAPCTTRRELWCNFAGRVEEAVRKLAGDVR